ncbi:hypothetical protein AB0L70_35930 [Kribbella sp. NPDC051952]|uniref:hypothetical protein n=1 Tax=Kribbella sp. NPDC051952 TaxID=3154851 RepID=UPI003445A658
MAAVEMSKLTLSRVEKRLLQCVRDGDELDLSNGELDVTAEEMMAWSAERTIRADVIREILRGRGVDDPDPRGIKLTGARIEGPLNLRHLEAAMPLRLYVCFLPAGADLGEGRFRALGMPRCRVEHALDLTNAHVGGQLDATGATLRNDSGTALRADKLAVDGNLSLDEGFSATGSGGDGAVRLAGARIGGQLVMSRATLSNDSGPALIADGLRVEQDLFLDEGFSATGSSEAGAVCLSGVYVGGQIDASAATLTNASGPALAADQLTVDQGLFISHGFEAIGSGRAAVRLRGAHVGGKLDASGAALSNDSGPALDATRTSVDDSIYLTEGFTATGSSGGGAVCLLGARVGGQLNLCGATLSNDSGPGLDAELLAVEQGLFMSDGFRATGGGRGAVVLVGAHVSGPAVLSGAILNSGSGPALNALRLVVDENLFMDNGFTAIGAGDDGAVCLLGAHVGGQIIGVRAMLTNESGPALTADGLRVEQDLFLTDGFSATGSSDAGAVRLPSAHVGGQLGFVGASLRNDSGPAFVADGLTVDHGLFLQGFEAIGSGEDGAVRLLGANVGGPVKAAGASMRNDSGPALVADGLTADYALLLQDGFSATGHGKQGTLTLAGARVGAFAIDISKVRDKSGGPGWLDVDGLTYAGLPSGPSVEDWLSLLAYRTPAYAAQPYQHLATAARAAGHEADAREILIAQRQDQLRRKAITGRRERAWARLTGLLLGYGYKPGRALVGLLAVVAISVILTCVAGQHGGLIHRSQTMSPGTACNAVERIGLGLDLSLPLIKTSASATCTTAATHTGNMLTMTGWFLQAAAWALATLFIAGFTGAVRKT